MQASVSRVSDVDKSVPNPRQRSINTEVQNIALRTRKETRPASIEAFEVQVDRGFCKFVAQTNLSRHSEAGIFFPSGNQSAPEDLTVESSNNGQAASGSLCIGRGDLRPCASQKIQSATNAVSVQSLDDMAMECCSPDRKIESLISIYKRNLSFRR